MFLFIIELLIDSRMYLHTYVEENIYIVFSPAILSNIFRYLNNIFYEVWKKVIITETFYIDFYNRFIKFRLFWIFFFSSFIYV